jgi:hypothetical protein
MDAVGPAIEKPVSDSDYGIGAILQLQQASVGSRPDSVEKLSLALALEY